jgi:hypothetical protein
MVILCIILRKTIESIIRHRLSREAKVIRKLEDSGETNLEALTALVYDDVSEHLHPIAKFSLEAHLIKLLKRALLKKTKIILLKFSLVLVS